MALNKNYLVQRLYRYKNRYTIQKDQPKKLRLNIMKNNLKTAKEEADIFMDWISGIDGTSLPFGNLHTPTYAFVSPLTPTRTLFLGSLLFRNCC